MQPTCLLQDRTPRERVLSLAFIPLTSADSRSFRQRSTHFAAAQNNSFRMTLFHKNQNNFLRNANPGGIVGPGTLLESAHSGENPFAGNQQTISRLESHPCNKRKNNCPRITLLQKKEGEGYVPSSLTLVLEGSTVRHHLLDARICSTSISIAWGVNFPPNLGMRCMGNHPLPLAMILCRPSAEVAVAFPETSDGPPRKWPRASGP
jgi:hypothetical protein